MNPIIKSTLVAMLFLFSSLSFAGLDSRGISAAGWEKLSVSQQADIMKKIEEGATVASDAIPGATTLKKVDEYAQMGERIGKMMGGAAKEVGVQVNEFIKTPVGKWTMAIVIWKYIGAVLVHVIGGLLILITGLAVTYKVYLSSTPYSIEYDTTNKNWFGKPLIKSKTRTRMSDDNGWVIFWMFTVTIAVFLVTTFSF